MSTGLEFRLLGPLEVCRDGERLRLGGERQRTLLALLLIHANAVVSSDQLLDHLFGEDAAETSANALQVAVSRLRRVLDDGIDTGEPRMLLTRPPGYELRVNPDRLDVSQFERLFEEGRSALAGGDPATSLSRLRAALALWRGPALADLALLDTVQPEIRRLEELRLAALMERVDAELALGAGGALVAELEALAAANPYHERLRGQLMLALYRSGRQADALAVYRQTREFLRDELGLEPSRALQELEQSILRQEVDLEPPARPAPGEVATDDTVMVCPFKGLASFQVVDAEYFFGRERMIGDLVARLTGASLVGLVGASGSGKSSVLRAGIVPALSAGALPGSDRWRLVLMRPGAHPLTELNRALGADPATILSQPAEAAPVVLAVDQFEELFTTCSDSSERAGFIDELVRLAVDPDRRAFVLLALRADFYGQCATYTAFAELLSRNHVLVGPMDRNELARAVELPAARSGLQIERGLVDALVDDVAGEPGALPLLSTMLLELWRLREGRLLRLQTYRLTGGVHGAVARLAEDTYGSLDPEGQQTARRVLLRLTVGDIATVARRRLPMSTVDTLPGAARVVQRLVDARLLTVSGSEVEVAHEALLHEWPRFRRWLEEDEAGRRLHEHLAASAVEWNQRGRDPADLYRGARLAATLDWTSQHQSELVDIEGRFVVASREQAEREQKQVEAESVRQIRLNRRLRFLLSGTAVLLAVAVLAGTLALVKQHDAQSATKAALARQLGAEAVVEPRVDLAMLLAREADNLDPSAQTEGTFLATLLRSPAAIAAFALPLGVRPLRMTLSPDANTLVVVDNDSSVHFFDTRTRADARPPLTNVDVDPSPVYSADGSRLLLAENSDSPDIAVLDGRTLRTVARLPLDPRWLNNPTTDNPSESLFFSSDNLSVNYVYSVTGPHGAPGATFLDRWELPSGRLLSSSQMSSDTLLGMRPVDGGRALVVLTKDAAEWLDAQTFGVVKRVELRSATVSTPHLVISPDGTSAAFGSVDGSVSFVDLTTGVARTIVGSHSAAVVNTAYAPDGRVVVTTSDDRRVIVWDPVAARPLEVLAGHSGRPLGIAFSADGTSLYTCALDGVVLEWDLGSGRRFGQPFTFAAAAVIGPSSDDTPGTPPLAISPDGSRFAVRAGPLMVAIFSTRTLTSTVSVPLDNSFGTVTSLAWSPSGDQIAVAGHGGAIQIWDVRGPPRLLRPLQGLAPVNGFPEAVQSVAFSSDGRQAAATDVAHTAPHAPPAGRLAIWQTSTGTPSGPPIDLGAPGNAVAFSRDDRWLAVAEADGPVVIVDTLSRKPARTLHPFQADNGGTVSVAFSRRGTLATGTWAGIVQLWHPETGSPIEHPVLVTPAPVASLTFDPTGDRFATTGGSDGSLKIWFTSTLQEEGITLDDEQGTWGAAQFTPDGRSLLSIHSNGRAYRWPVDLKAWREHACAVAGRNMTREEWQRFVIGLSYSSTCS